MSDVTEFEDLKMFRVIKVYLVGGDNKIFKTLVFFASKYYKR